MRKIFFALLVSLLARAGLEGVDAPAASDADLKLTPEYRLGELGAMPRPPMPPGGSAARVDYSGEDAAEWKIRIAVPASVESPLYENLKSADFVVQFPSTNGPSVHWSLGSRNESSDFAPRSGALVTGKPFVLESFGGRSSDGAMPYFNLADGGGGLILAVGWTGDWKASFESLGGGRVRVVAGLKRSRFRLRPGEEVRLPSVLVMSYRGAWTDGQNRFRRLMLQHFTPVNHSPMELMPVAASVHGLLGFNVTTETNLSALAVEVAGLKLPIDTFWLDAGWNQGGFPAGQGNPNPDPVRFPRGLAPVGKVVGDAGMRFLVWFEPERAMRGTWLEREHPEWLRSASGTPPELRYMEKDGFRLLDLGNPYARRWAIDNVSRQLRETGIGIYRQDFNQYPSFFWQTDEPADEVGLREIRHINGLYDFLDALLRRHPDLIIDNCASGGRRLDFEMMRRSVVLWRSDSCWDAKSFPRNMQAMTHGLSHWLPLHGVGALTTDDVALRSGMGSCASYAVNFHDAAAVAALRSHLNRFLQVRALFAEDFHPLTPWSDDPAEWLAFQFHDAAKGEGIVQAFRGESGAPQEFNLKLGGLDAAQGYLVSDWDRPGEVIRKTGLELGAAGLKLTARDRGTTAVVLQYRVENGSAPTRPR